MDLSHIDAAVTVPVKKTQSLSTHPNAHGKSAPKSWSFTTNHSGRVIKPKKKKASEEFSGVTEASRRSLIDMKTLF